LLANGRRGYAGVCLIATEAIAISDRSVQVATR